MYVTLKVHEVNVPLRPILLTIGTFNYSLSYSILCFNYSKWFVPQVSHLGCNEYCIRHSFSFANEVAALKNNTYNMANFDVDSFFTNISIDETCSIILNMINDEKLL